MSIPTEVLTTATQPYPVSFWGIEALVTPVLVETVFGDGQHLVGVEPLATRPAYYLVRIESTWQLENWAAAGELLCDHLEEIYDAIEEQYGRADDSEEDEEPLPWPALDMSCGVSWFSVYRIAESSDGA